VTGSDLDVPLSRTAASTAVADIGWRYLLGVLVVSVPVRSLAQGSEVAAAAVAAKRNRVHFDITVAHDEAEPRVHAALAAGGRLADDSHARSFWVLADAEGNEVCVCTWTDRDERE
jgi:hypothetical protein